MVVILQFCNKDHLNLQKYPFLLEEQSATCKNYWLDATYLNYTIKVKSFLNRDKKMWVAFFDFKPT